MDSSDSKTATESSNGETEPGFRSRRAYLSGISASLIVGGTGCLDGSNPTDESEGVRGPLIDTPNPGSNDGPDRPNIVFILLDDLAFNAIGAAGWYPFLETPNIDRLVHEGALCENAFATTPLCSPARASFLTGTYAHRHGVVENQTRDPDPSLPTFAELLQADGYDTGFVGKWHMEPTAEPRDGFDYWLSFAGQGEHFNPTLNENGDRINVEGYMTDILNEHSLEFINQADSDQPFMLYSSQKAVHRPFKPAPRHDDRYDGEAAPKPPTWGDDYADKPEWMRRAFEYKPVNWEESKDKPIPETLDPGQWPAKHPKWINYLEMTLAVDEHVRDVMKKLDENGILDETMIVFTSDHGMMLGSHNRPTKSLPYEHSIRIPMLIRYPPLIEAGSSIGEMVLNLDIMPTFLDLAGVPVPDSCQGRSMLPLFQESGDYEWRDHFLLQYYQHSNIPGYQTWSAVRSRDWKYVTYPESPGSIDELYDLTVPADEMEMENLAVSPKKNQSKLSEMKSQLEELKAQTDFVPPEKIKSLRAEGKYPNDG